ncbi:hypothetical protein [Haladaptatus caseinilyticus]|uniref:hypothetical protein n=1 Tax=Haladaptatus caseinilyticus TaxID=2993314 RepID=UPI00224B3513|nr:hypothetical protein [Haladaptatus caseinilyticus]
MSQSNQNTTRGEHESIHREYILGVQIVAVECLDGKGTQYQFDAPGHIEVPFENPDMAELYADVYFDVNGFEEAGTGERGVPPEIIQAGRDTLAAYFLTQPYSDINWVASFYGKKPTEIERYVASVRRRAQEIRESAEERGME